MFDFIIKKAIILPMVVSCMLFNFNAKAIEQKVEFEYKTDSTYRLYASICLASDWVGVCNYSSSYSYITKSNFESTLEKTSPKSISVTLKTNEVFPMKTSNWPVPVTISTPDAYLLLVYFTFEKGVETLHFDVIHYTYKEFYVAGVTSPAI